VVSVKAKAAAAPVNAKGGNGAVAADVFHEIATGSMKVSDSIMQ
jgi:hypothetical protein